MERELILADQRIKYQIRKSEKARYMRLTIYFDGSLVATIPRSFSENALEKFILKKADWISKKIKYFKTKVPNQGSTPYLKSNKRDYKKYKSQALALARERLEFYNQFYNFEYKKISVRNQKARWGSCSRSGNLCFNYRIALLPENLRDYIIVHELCHLGQFNHSRDFWELVGRTVPDFKKSRAEVRRI
jgi:hypothetical protein